MTPLEKLRYHVTGAIERGEAIAVVEQPAEHVTLNGESWMSGDAVREAREELVAELVREYCA